MSCRLQIVREEMERYRDRSRQCASSICKLSDRLPRHNRSEKANSQDLRVHLLHELTPTRRVPVSGLLRLW